MIRLADFDPEVVADYAITEKYLDRVARYLRLLQSSDALALKDVALGGYYGTSALLHKVVELDILLEQEPGLLEMDQNAILDFWCLINESYPIRFRVLPEIRTIEGTSHREIRDQLWEVIFEEMKNRRSERPIEYASPEPVYQTVRERPGKANDAR